MTARIAACGRANARSGARRRDRCDEVSGPVTARQCFVMLISRLLQHRPGVLGVDWRCGRVVHGLAVLSCNVGFGLGRVYRLISGAFSSPGA